MRSALINATHIKKEYQMYYNGVSSICKTFLLANNWHHFIIIIIIIYHNYYFNDQITLLAKYLSYQLIIYS